jgi:hypothetical protein
MVCALSSPRHLSGDWTTPTVTGRVLERVRQLQNAQIISMTANDLHANRQS